VDLPWPTSAALVAYGKAISIYETLAQRKPKEAQFIADRTRSYSKVADLESVMGDLQGSLALDMRSREARAVWLKAHPEDRPARRGFAANLQSIGGRLDQLGRYEESLVVRRQALNGAGPQRKRTG
jgi:tetratricopeptide (TPR) repeat protein